MRSPRNAIGFGPEGRPGLTFGFGGGAWSLNAWRIASSWVWVRVPFATRPSRIALILSFDESSSVTAVVTGGTLATVVPSPFGSWKPARAAPPMNAVVKALAATARAHLFLLIPPSRSPLVSLYQSTGRAVSVAAQGWPPCAVLTKS